MERQATIILAVTLVVYALYTTIFGACIFLLLRAKIVWWRWLLTTTCILYISISTAMFLFIFGRGSLAMNLIYNIAALVAHILADVILLWRCYLIWNDRWRIILVPSSLVLVSLVFGLIRVIYLSQHTFALHSIHAPKDRDPVLTTLGLMGFYVVSLLANLILTGLSAGRIWYLTRGGQFVLQETNRSPFHAVVAMMVESGLTYSLCLLAVIGSFIAGAAGARTKGMDLALGITLSLALQASGLMPTLILVRSAVVSRFHSDSSHTRAMEAVAMEASFISPFVYAAGQNIVLIPATMDPETHLDVPFPVHHQKAGFESWESMELGGGKANVI